MPRWLSAFLRGFALLAVTVPAACGETSIPTLEGDALDPEKYRPQIVSIDAILFEDGGLGDTDRAVLDTRFRELEAVASSDPSNTIAVMIGRDLKRLAGMAKSAKVGTPLKNSQLRLQWMRIRSSLFSDAWWWRHSSADPIVRS